MIFVWKIFEIKNNIHIFASWIYKHIKNMTKETFEKILENKRILWNDMGVVKRN
jgi:flagellar biosynthesis protein FliQ